MSKSKLDLNHHYVGIIPGNVMEGGTLGRVLIGGIAFATSQHGEKLDESKRSSLRHQLDGTVTATVLPLLYAGLIPADEHQKLHDALDKAYIFAYGGDALTAQRHGMFKRREVKAYKKALGVDTGVIGKKEPQVGTDMAMTIDTVCAAGFDKFVKDRLDLTINLPGAVIAAAHSAAGD
ncbi:hypothetical protein K2Q00_00890 [Patescibacteria group bacterium]|nr:hypothetical protein [Patescibacteria group bacterium]